MYTQRLAKSDGRPLLLYARDAPPDGRCAPSPPGAPPPPNAHLRWHPLRGEWVAYAGHRQHRTFLPPPEYNPLAPSCDGAHPTEVPEGRWDVAVFENMFPTFTAAAHDPPTLSACPPPQGAASARLSCSRRTPRASLASAAAAGTWSCSIDVWADRYDELGRRDGRRLRLPVREPWPGRRRDAAPPARPDLRLSVRAAAAGPRAGAAGARTSSGTAAGCSRSWSRRRWRTAARLIYGGAEVAAFLPVCARYAFEVWIAPHRPAPSFAALDARRAARLRGGPEDRADEARRGLAGAVALRAGLPPGADRRAPHPEAHLHAELYPAWRMRGRMKYLAGSELGAGVFTADTLPEERAQGAAGGDGGHPWLRRPSTRRSSAPSVRHRTRRRSRRPAST